MIHKNIMKIYVFGKSKYIIKMTLIVRNTNSNKFILNYLKHFTLLYYLFNKLSSIYVCVCTHHTNQSSNINKT